MSLTVLDSSYKQYHVVIVFYICLIHLSIISPRSIPVVTNGRISFFLKPEWGLPCWLRDNAVDTGLILVWEDPTCRIATKPERHNYCACALARSRNYWAHTGHAEDPRAQSLCSATREEIFLKPWIIYHFMCISHFANQEPEKRFSLTEVRISVRPI